MTERDKKLLVFLGIFVVVVGIGWLVLRPMTQQLSDTKYELAIAEEEKLEKEEKLTLLPLSEKQAENLRIEIDTLTEDYDSFMASQEIDRLLTTMALQHHLEARELNISMPEDYLLLAPYYASFTAQSLAASAGEDAKDLSSSMTGIFAAQTTLVLGGNRNDLQSLLDEWITDCPAIRVTSFSWKTAGDKYDFDYFLTSELETYMREE